MKKIGGGREIRNIEENFEKINQLHALSRTEHGDQREFSVKTLASLLQNFWWQNFCVLSGGTQRRSLVPERRNDNINK